MSGKNYDILVLEGDGIGPEVTAEAIKVLEICGERFNAGFALSSALVGGAAIEAEGAPVSDETVQAARNADAVLLGISRLKTTSKYNPLFRSSRITLSQKPLTSVRG